MKNNSYLPEGRKDKSPREYCARRRVLLVGLVRALFKRAAAWQRSKGGSGSSRSLHGGRPSRSSPIMPCEWPLHPSQSAVKCRWRLDTHAQRRLPVPRCSDYAEVSRPCRVPKRCLRLRTIMGRGTVKILDPC